MSLALTLQNVHHDLRTKRRYIKATVSGNYTLGGDTLDLTTVQLALGQDADGKFGFPGTIRNSEVISAPAGFTANLVVGSTLTNWGMQVFQTASEAPDGLPLGLGALSAAATQSTLTSAG